jgi:hypothetical protein
MSKKTTETTVVTILKFVVRQRFYEVRKHTQFLFDSFAPSLDDIDRQFKRASGEVSDMLADEAAAINGLIDQTVPLILLRTYASFEAFAFNFIGMVTLNPNIKIDKDWKKAIKALEGVGVSWDSIPDIKHIETLRLLVNSYKHHDGKVHNNNLAGLIGIHKGKPVDWGAINYEVYIAACEKTLNYLIRKIK